MSSLSSLSARHQELINAIIKNLGNADIDWESVARDANFSSAKYAKDEYRKARKVLDAGGLSSPKKKAASKKRKYDDEDDTTTIPAKKTKNGRKQASKKASSEEAEQDGKEAGFIKPEADDDDGELV